MINNKEKLPGETFEEEAENDLHEIQADDDLNEPDAELDAEGHKPKAPDSDVLTTPNADEDKQ